MPLFQFPADTDYVYPGNIFGSFFSTPSLVVTYSSCNSLGHVDSSSRKRDLKYRQKKK